MGLNLDSVTNVILDRSSQEWIQCLVVAFVLALVLGGVHLVCRRWTKADLDSATLVGMSVLAIFAGMVIAGVYVQVKANGTARLSAGAAAAGVPARGPGGGGGGGGGGGRMTTRMASLIFENADADHDGLLSTDEAVTAAAKFIKDADTEGKGTLDRDVLTSALRARLGPPGGGNPPPPAAPKPASPPSP